MRLLAFLVFVIGTSACTSLTSTSGSAPAETPPVTTGLLPVGPGFSVKTLAPHTYLVTDETFFSSNVLVTWMGDDTVLIVSSPFETVGTKALMTWVRRKFGPVKVIDINTHFHSDGVGGNEGFLDDNVEIWASDLTKKLQSSKGALLKKELLKEITDPELKKRIEKRQDVVAPNIFELAKGKQFTFKNETVQVIYPGPAHSPDNVVVYFPQRELLFGGCMIRSATSDIGYLGNADVTKWPDSARSLQSLAIKIVVPGHGAPAGPELIQRTIELATQASAPKAGSTPAQ